MRGETAIHENRKDITKNEVRGNLEMALFIVCSFLCKDPFGKFSKA
jgi:hypothetical protein